MLVSQGNLFVSGIPGRLPGLCPGISPAAIAAVTIPLGLDGPVGGAEGYFTSSQVVGEIWGPNQPNTALAQADMNTAYNFGLAATAPVENTDTYTLADGTEFTPGVYADIPRLVGSGLTANISPRQLPLVDRVEYGSLVHNYLEWQSRGCLHTSREGVSELWVFRP